MWRPQDMGLRFFLGKLYYRLEMVDEAFNTLIAIDLGDRDYPDLHKLLGNIYLRRGSLGLAAAEFKKALRFKKQVIVPYVCSNCSYSTVHWSGRCPNCGKWNTFGVDLEKSSIWFGSQLPRTFYRYGTPIVPGASLEELRTG